ncbi:MAG: hypothetical protein ABSA53_06655 [Streptosporangiaceae bacterium]|jgi:hypothetical protein
MSITVEIQPETVELARTTSQLRDFLSAERSIMTSREMFEAMFADHTPMIDIRTPADVQAQKRAGEL